MITSLLSFILSKTWQLSLNVATWGLYGWMIGFRESQIMNPLHTLCLAVPFKTRYTLQLVHTAQWGPTSVNNSLTISNQIFVCFWSSSHSFMTHFCTSGDFSVKAKVLNDFPPCFRTTFKGPTAAEHQIYLHRLKNLPGSAIPKPQTSYVHHRSA